MATGFNAKIHEVFYTTASGNIGDIVSDSTLNAATWKQIITNSDTSNNLAEDREPLTSEQFSEEILSPYSQPGLFDYSGSLNFTHYSGFGTEHEDLLESALGTLVDSSAVSAAVISAVTNDYTFTCATAAALPVGAIVEINGELAVIKSNDAGDIVLYTSIKGLSTSMTLTGRKCFNPKVLGDNNYYHFLFITSIGSFVATWVKPALKLTTEMNSLRNWELALMGDQLTMSAVTKATISSGGGSITASSQKVGVFPNWKRTFLNTNAIGCALAKCDFVLDRTQTKKPQACTETSNGFGGVDQDEVILTSEIHFNVALPTAIKNAYNAATKIFVFAFSKDAKLAIFADGAGITRINASAIAEGQYRPLANLDLKEKEGGIIRILVD